MDKCRALAKACDWLKEKANLGPEFMFDNEEIRSALDIEDSRLQSENAELSRQIESLEGAFDTIPFLPLLSCAFVFSYYIIRRRAHEIVIADERTSDRLGRERGALFGDESSASCNRYGIRE
jgi:hypothetical protein